MALSEWFLLFWVVVVMYSLGVIWFAQIVVYPLFSKVGSDDYVTYHRFYSRRIPLPVIIPGFGTFLIPFVLLFFHPAYVPGWMLAANAVCGLVGFLVTVVLEIPRHSRLERFGKQENVISELVLYNWPRTAAISVSALLTLFMLAAMSTA